MNKDGSSDKGTSMGVQNWRSGCTSPPTSVLIPDVMPFKLEVSTVNLIDLLTVPHSNYIPVNLPILYINIYNIHPVTTLKYTNFKIYRYFRLPPGRFSLAHLAIATYGIQFIETQ